MKLRKDGKLNWFLLLRLFGVVLFILVLFRVDLTQVWQSISKIQIGFFLLALLFQFILLVTKGIRWYLLQNRKTNNLSFFKTLSVFFESYAFGVATPGRVGEFVKVGYEQGKADKISSALRIVSERGFDLGVFVLFAGTMLFASVMFEKLIGLGVIILSLVLIVCAFLLLVSKPFNKWIAGLIGRMFKQTKSITIEHNHNLSSATLIFLLSIVGSVCHFISCYWLAIGLNIEMSFIRVSGIVAIAGLLNLLPITIMGLGTREVTFLYFFSTISQPVVLAFSFLVFFAAQIGGGLISLILSFIFAVKRNK